MSIIGTLPVSLQNGTLADATQVMSDFNFIVTAVNANAAALSGNNAFVGDQSITGNVTASGNLTAAALIPTSSTIPANGLYLKAANNPAISSNGTVRWDVNSTGQHTFAKPTSGYSGVNLDSTARSLGSGWDNKSFLFGSTASSVTGNFGISYDDTTGATLESVTPGGSWHPMRLSATSYAIKLTGADALTANTAGNWNVVAPSSGVAWTVNGAAITPTSSQAFTATPTLNASLSNVFEFSGAMTANVTSVTITNPTAGQTITWRVKQDGTGSRTVATPSGAKIAGTVGPTAGLASILTLTYSAMDARWEGAWTQLP